MGIGIYFRGSDKRAGKWWKEFAFLLKKYWDVNNPTQLSTVLKTMKVFKHLSTESIGWKGKFLFADLIVLRCCGGIEQAAKMTGS